MGQRGTEVAKALGSVTLWWMRFFSSLEQWTSWMSCEGSAGQWFGLWLMNYEPQDTPFITLPKTNIAPENRPFEKETSIPTIHFQVLC